MSATIIFAAAYFGMLTWCVAEQHHLQRSKLKVGVEGDQNEDLNALVHQ